MNDVVKNFDLGTILTYTTNHSCVDDFYKVFELAWFVFNDKTINDSGLCFLGREIRRHIITIHPELAKIRYDISKDVHEFVNKQKEIFGDVLPVTRMGVSLPKDKIKKIGEK